MSKRLYVGNISYKATEESLKELFSKAGEVVSVRLLTDAATGKLRGFGFVEMAADEDADKAITMFNKTDYLDRSLVVNEAKPQEKRKPRREMRQGGSPYSHRRS